MRTRTLWILIVVLFLGVRIRNAPGILTDQGVELNDTDPYYRLHRIERIVKSDLTYPLRDPALSYPDGFDVPWPTGLDHLVALPLKALGIQKRLTIEVFATLAIPVLALPSLYFAGATATFFGGVWFALAAGFLTALAPTDIFASGLGRLDHHFLEGLLTAAAFYFLTRRKWKTLAVLLALAPAFWPQAWVLSLFVTAAALFSRDPLPRRHLPASLLAASLLSQVPLALSDRFAAGTVSLLGFSWWSTLVYAALAAGLYLFSGLRRAIFPALYAGAMAMFLAARNGLSFFGQTARTAVDVLSASSGVLQTTTETISTFFLPIRHWPELGLILLVLAWVWFLLQAFRKERWEAVGYFAGPLILCALQARFVPLASPVMILASLFLAQDLSRKFVKFPEYQNAVFGMLVILMAIPSVPRLQWDPSGNAHPLYRPIRHASWVLSERNQLSGLPPEKRAIAAHWDYGHWLLYYGKMPVVSHPFQGPSSMETLNLFVSETDGEYSSFLKRHPVRYFLVETPTMRVSSWLTLTGKPAGRYLKTVSKPDGSKQEVPLDPFYRLLSYRLFMQNGVDPRGESFENLRLVFVSPSSFYGHEGPPAVKVFERVEGARVRIRSKEKSLSLVAKIKTREGEFYYHREARPDRKGEFEWRAPYARTEAGGVSYDGRFWIETPSGRRKDFPVVLSENDVVRGELIDLGSTGW